MLEHSLSTFIDINVDQNNIRYEIILQTKHCYETVDKVATILRRVLHCTLDGSCQDTFCNRPEAQESLINRNSHGH